MSSQIDLKTKLQALRLKETFFPPPQFSPLKSNVRDRQLNSRFQKTDIISQLDSLQASLKGSEWRAHGQRSPIKNSKISEPILTGSVLKRKLREEINNVVDSIAPVSPLKKKTKQKDNYKLDFGNFGKNHENQTNNNSLFDIFKERTLSSRKSDLFSVKNDLFEKKNENNIFGNSLKKSDFIQKNDFNRLSEFRGFKDQSIDFQNKCSSLFEKSRRIDFGKNSSVFEKKNRGSELGMKNLFDKSLKSSFLAKTRENGENLPIENINELNDFLRNAASKGEIEKLPNSFVRELLGLANNITKIVKSSKIYA